MLKLSYTLLKNIINAGFPFWFINFDLTKEEIIKYNSFKSGEFYVTRRWIRGLISNFFIITKAYRKYLIKKEFVDSNKVRDLYDKWVFTRFTWPRAVFISNVKSAFIVSKETSSARVPSIALVDTNVKTISYNIPIGCNDDSLESIGFMNNIISQYILKCKYKKVLIWYYFNRNIRKVKTFLDWLKNLIKLKKNVEYKINIKNMLIPNFVDYFSKVKNSLKFFFGRSYNNRLYRKKKELKGYNNFLDPYYDINKILFYNKLKVLNYKILSYKYRIKFKRYNILEKIEGVSSFKSFLNNFIKLNGFVSRKKRIKLKKRIKIARKRVPLNFKRFFSFIFFFFLNKFNIIIDSYNKQNFNLIYLLQISKNYRKKYRHRNINKHLNLKKYRSNYVFRYKSKKIYKKKKSRKYGFIYESFNNINIQKYSMSFLFFYWKYFIIFLGLKLYYRPHFYRPYFLKKKKI
jgi:ribosomal protein S2